MDNTSYIYFKILCYRMPLAKFLRFFYFFCRAVGLCKLSTRSNREISSPLTRVVYTLAAVTLLFKYCLCRVDVRASKQHSCLLHLLSGDSVSNISTVKGGCEVQPRASVVLCSLGISAVSFLPHICSIPL